MKILMDMGTSSTRLWLVKGDAILAQKKGAFGASLSQREGKEGLFAALSALLDALLLEANATAESVSFIAVSGMAGSEIGLYDLPHTTLPTGLYELSARAERVVLPEVSSIPFLFVPGVKVMAGEGLADLMRGEETEVAGILSRFPEAKDSLIVLPGTHNKYVRVDGEGQIIDFHTAMSGELIAVIMGNTILRDALSFDFTLDEAALLRGAAYVAREGLGAALFSIRVAAKNGKSKDDLTSFLFGAVLSEDAAQIRRRACGARVFVGGRASLRRALVLLLEGERVYELDESISSGAVREGLLRICSIRARMERRGAVLRTVEREKLIAIVRNPDDETLLPAVEALYAGGVRLIELTFDRTGTVSAEKTAERIRRLSEAFADRMLVGAGTVTRDRELCLARDAGAAFIISPNLDAALIRKTRAEGLVSMPAAMTPTEIAAAVDAGADYVKLFPANALADGYFGAVTAPLSDAKLLAVGGVTAENTAELLARGFCGVGVGGNLYDKKLIAQGDYAGLTALAKQFTEATK